MTPADHGIIRLPAYQLDMRTPVDINLFLSAEFVICKSAA
jgi:hypothetical protein